MKRVETQEQMNKHEHTRAESWWEHDVQGIPLARVCRECVKFKLKGYDRAVLTDEQCETLGVSLDRPRYVEVVEEQIEDE